MSNTPTNEELLLVFGEKGQEAGDQVLVENLTPDIFAVGMKILRDTNKASEATQRTWVNVYRSHKQFINRGPDSARKWVVGIAWRAAIDVVREPTGPAELPDDLQAGQDSSANPEELAALHNALKQLEPRRQAVLILAEKRGMGTLTLAELAPLLGYKDIASVNREIDRALQDLRARMLPQPKR